MMGRLLILVALSFVLLSLDLVLGDDSDTDINLDDGKLTQEEVLFLFKYIGLEPEMASNFTDMIMADGDTDADGVIEQKEMKTWV